MHFSFLAQRVIQALVTLLTVSLVSFALMKSLPGDPLDILLGSAQKDIAPQELDTLRRELGLNQDPVKQYSLWLASWLAPVRDENLALGLSYRDGRPVKEVIMERLPATLALCGLALVLSFSLGIALGAILAYLRLRGERSPAVRSLSLVVSAALAGFYAMPAFWLAFLLVAALALRPDLYPPPIFGISAPGKDVDLTIVAYLLPPALILSLRRLVKVALYVKELALQELSSPYVLSALAKGLSLFQVTCRHVLKNCLVPVVNLLGLSAPSLVGGSVLIETIFCLPGLGRLSVEAAFGRNYPVLLSLSMLYGTVVVVASFAADCLSRSLDVRLKEGN